MNLSSVRDGVVRTPPIGNALAGITRAQVINVTRRTGRSFIETPLTVYDFETAEEVFATSASAGLFPIGSIGSVRFDAAPGPVTRDLQAAYVEHALTTGTPVH